MPNVKIYVDEALMPDCRDRLVGAMQPLRATLCAALDVDVAACQFALIPVIAMPDLPRVNVEMHVMSNAGRTRERLTALASEVQALIDAACGSRTAVRIATLVPDGYVAMK